ncbi:MAG: hypothetical protein R3F08_08345 [Dokdonella sp.]
MKVFSDDAQLIIVDRSGRERQAELPGTRYYRVAAAEDPGLSGVLAVAEAGNVFGLTRHGAEFSQLRFEPDGQLTLDRIDMEAAPARVFECANDRSETGMSVDPASLLGHAGIAGAGPSAPAAAYAACVAIETDTEFLGRFSGNTTNARTTWAADRLHIDDLRCPGPDQHAGVLPAPVDGARSVCRDLAGLPAPRIRQILECQQSTCRTTMQLLSGKTTTAGIAWVGVLCRVRSRQSQSALGISCDENLPASGD